MSDIIKENIIIPAWNIVKNDAKIKRIYLLPGIFSILFFTGILVYQSIYTYVVIFHQKEDALILILNFFHSGYFIEILISALLFILIYFLITPIFDGALIHYIGQKDLKMQSQGDDYVSFADAFGVGIYRFLPLFEFNNIFSEFKIITVLNAYLFVIRFLGMQFINVINYTFLFILVFSMIINMIFSYTPYEIVLKSGKVMGSIGVSAKLAILNPKVTVKLYFLMFVLNLRIIFNFLVFLIFPVLIFSALAYISSQFFLILTLLVVGGSFVFFLILLAYMASVLDVFKTAIWYYAYKSGKTKLSFVEGKDDE